jgi:hypothetical protein
MLNNFKAKASILIVFLVFFISICVFPQTLLINEFMSSNSTAIADEDGDYSDWIELHNTSNQAISLAGYGLSDDPGQPYRWVFPAKGIQPGGFLLIWASGKNRTNSQQPLHTNFSISAAGETLLLTHPSGDRVDSTVAITLQADISYGRLRNQFSEWRFFSPSTPGSANSETGFSLFLQPASVSHSDGYYTSAIELSMSTTQNEAQIYYSTDGSVPTAESNLYTEPFLVQSRVGEPNTISMIPTNNNNDPGPPYYEGWQPPLGEVYKINVIRVRPVHPDAPPGPVTTHTYIVDPSGNQRYSLPVFSLSTDFNNLFDAEIGIYVYGNHDNYFQDGMEWERPANLTLFEKEGNLAFSEDIGIRIHGNTSRSRPRKSLRINARDEYGNSWINYQLFHDKSTDMFKRFILRNSGNDWDQTVFRDAVVQSLMRNLDVDRQYYQPAILFINGEYWGIHNVRDRYDEHYIYARYGIEEMEMTILENNSTFKFGNPGGANHYNSMRSFVNSNNLLSDENFTTLSTRMDIESFTDFQIANIYAMNTDWPGNNSLFWRYLRNGYEPGALNGRDGRWRWMLLDMDFAFGLNFNYVPGATYGASHNTLSFALSTNGPNWPNPPWSTFLLRNLLINVNYKHQFINRFCDLLNTNFKETNVVSVIDSVKNMLQPEMQEHILRWRRPTILSEWLNNVNVMRVFAQQRPAFMRQHIKNQFSLQGTAQLTIRNNNPEMGTVQVNSIEIDDLIWQGIYFTQIPIKLKAHPKHGYRFVGWTGQISSQSETAELIMTANSLVEAVFEPSNDFAGDSLNPVAYRLANGPYHFTYWDENNAERNFPENMVFQQSSKNDPLQNDPMTRPYHIPAGEYHADDMGSVGFPYRLTRRTRLNGLGSEGVSFINTGRGRDLGAAVLAIDTRGLENITVGWTAGTVIPNSRAYAIILQYRIGHEGSFYNVTNQNGEPLEYIRNEQAGHTTVFSPVTLPAEANNQPYLQLRWKYFFTGQQINQSDGSRDMLRLDDIVVSTVTMDVPEYVTNNPTVTVESYPNPFNDQTEIVVNLLENTNVEIAVFNLFGVKVATLSSSFLNSGGHTFIFDASQLPAGYYNCVIKTDKLLISRKLLKM